MEVSGNLLFFFSALGAFNGLLMSLYFFFYAKPRHPSHYFLGALLLTLSVRTGKSVFFYFSDHLAGFYVQFGLTACFFIGPSLYFYLKAATTPANEFQSKWKYHVAILLPLILLISYFFPYWDNLYIWRNYIIKFIYYQWLLYIVAAGFIIAKVYRQFAARKDKMNSVEIWLLSVYLGTCVVWMSYYFSRYTSYITGALSFSFLFYLLILLLNFNKKKDSILFKKVVQKYGAKKISSKEAQQLAQQLKVVMEMEELFRNPNLKLPDVAKALNTLPHRISQFINDNLQKSFSLWVNEYRVEAAKQMLLKDSPFTLEGIGYECGFNSKSTFYATFKKVVGTTPAKFKANAAKPML
ncbi:MAG: helix-turn-helix domain-containing protein [Bacteroidota bacterium]